MTRKVSHISVLIIPTYYGFGAENSLNRGAIYVKHQAMALARQGHRVVLIYVHFDSKRGVYISSEDDTSGLKSVFVHAKPLKIPLNVAYRMILTLWAFRRVYPKNRPDIIHCHSFRAALFARPIASLYRIPYIITEHSSQMKTRLPWFRRRLARWSYAGASRVIAVSSGLARTLRRYTDHHISVIPNLVTDEFFASGPPESVPPIVPFRFVSIGRSEPNKAWHSIIQAVAQLRVQDRNVTLTLGGGGSETDDLRHLAARLGVEDRVKFVGRLQPEAVRQAIARSHCHVLASRVETFGIVSIEALALGRPIIMTNTDAATTIVGPRDGLIVPVDDLEALTEAMQQLVDSYATYDGTEIRRRCWNRFSEQAICAKITSTYAEVLAERT